MRRSFQVKKKEESEKIDSISYKRLQIQKNTQHKYDSLQMKIKKIQPLFSKLSSSSRDLVITALFGSTGTGKSSLISYLLNANLQYTKFGGGHYRINHTKNLGQYPEIGHQKQSCTTTPTIYTYKLQNYVDLPGFFDTRNSDQQIINSICSSKLFAKHQSVKILIMIQVSQLNAQRGGKLVQVVNRISQIFQNDCKNIAKSAVLVISKGSTEQWSQNDLYTQIESIMKSNQNLLQQSIKLLKEIISKKRVKLFPFPHQITNHIQIIRQTVKMMPSTLLLKNSNISLSQSAKNAIRICKTDLNRELRNISNNLMSQAQEIFLYSHSQQNQFNLSMKMRLFQKLQKYLQNDFQLFKGQNYSLNQFIKFLANQLKLQKEKCEQFKKEILMINFYNEIIQPENQKENLKFYDFTLQMKRNANKIYQKLKEKKQKLQEDKKKKKLQYRRKKQIVQMDKRLQREKEKIRRQYGLTSTFDRNRQYNHQSYYNDEDEDENKSNNQDNQDDDDNYQNYHNNGNQNEEEEDENDDYGVENEQEDDDKYRSKQNSYHFQEDNVQEKDEKIEINFNDVKNILEAALTISTFGVFRIFK